MYFEASGTLKPGDLIRITHYERESPKALLKPVRSWIGEVAAVHAATGLPPGYPMRCLDVFYVNAREIEDLPIGRKTPRSVFWEPLEAWVR